MLVFKALKFRLKHSSLTVNLARKFIVVVGAAMLIAGCARQHAIETANQEQPTTLTIVYTANVSGEIEPCGCRGNPAGGIVRLWTFFENEVFPKKNASIVVDSGDLFFPSSPAPPFIANQWNTQAMALVDAYNALGFDAFAPGDWDFASGLDLFEQLRSKAKFAFLSANLYKNDALYLKPHVVLQRAGMKIGIFGLYDENLPLPSELSAKDHIEAAKEQVTALRGKVDVLIALTHLGLEGDQALARAVDGIDYILGAHSQSFLQDPVRVGNTTILQTSFRNQHVGIFSSAQIKMGQIKMGQNRLVPLDQSFQPKDTKNPMISLLTRTKVMIAELNRRNEADLEMSDKSASALTNNTQPHYQTFVRCAACHEKQHDFWKSTAHGHAYTTLVTKKQNYNKDCLACHTLGAGDAKNGWTNVNALVLSSKGSIIPPESFAKSYGKMDPSHLARYKKAYINVQCEHCHGPAQDHPYAGQNRFNAVDTRTCLGCHRQDQAPSWYKNGLPDPEVLKAKKSAISCPSL